MGKYQARCALESSIEMTAFRCYFLSWFSVWTTAKRLAYLSAFRCGITHILHIPIYLYCWPCKRILMQLLISTFALLKLHNSTTAQSICQWNVRRRCRCRRPSTINQSFRSSKPAEWQSTRCMQIFPQQRCRWLLLCTACLRVWVCDTYTHPHTHGARIFKGYAHIITRNWTISSGVITFEHALALLVNPLLTQPHST